MCPPSEEDHAVHFRNGPRALALRPANVPEHSHAPDDHSELSERIQSCLCQKQREWMSRSSVHVMRDANAQIVQVKFMSTLSRLPHPSLHAVMQCMCLEACWCPVCPGLFEYFENSRPQSPVEKLRCQTSLATQFFRPVALRDSGAWSGPACVGYSRGCRGGGFRSCLRKPRTPPV